MWCAGVPAFLANAACSGFIRWQAWPPPALGIASVLAAAVAYLAASHARWTRHLLRRPAPRPQVQQKVHDALNILKLLGEAVPAGCGSAWHPPPSRLTVTERFFVALCCSCDHLVQVCCHSGLQSGNATPEILRGKGAPGRFFELPGSNTAA